ncbi:MAG: hypothetical protein ACI9OJ_000911, partial [Myxococcota bacterium]
PALAKPEEPKPEEPKPEEPKPEEPKPEEPKPEEPKPEEPKPAVAAVAAVAKPIEAKPAQKPVVKAKPAVKAKPQFRRANFRSAYKAYSQKQFEAAVDKFSRIERDKKIRPSDRKKAKTLASRVTSFASVYKKAKQSIKAFQPASAIPALEKARSLDKKLTGAFQGEIRRSLAQAFAFRAAGAFQGKRYKKAAKLARKSLVYNEGEQSAQVILRKVEGKVEDLLARARSAKNSGNINSAEKSLKQVVGILPKSDRRYKEAHRMLKDIIAARAEEDDD